MGYFNLLDRISNRADLMERMMRKLGVREAVTQMPDAPSVMRNATIRCVSCSHSKECASWLDAATVPAHAPGYCRNRELFEFVADA